MVTPQRRAELGVAAQARVVLGVRVPLVFGDHPRHAARRGGATAASAADAKHGALELLVVLLPDRTSTLDDLERRLPKEFTSWVANLAAQEVIVNVPRFEMTLAMSMKDTLSRMGMSRAFSEHADFSGIDDGRERLRIGDVIHKAFVEVSEEGTEAAAATAVEMSLAMAAPGYQPPSPPKFIADHPFVYLVRDRQTGSILFLGRYVGK